MTRRAWVVGTGLIGGSIGFGLSASGWEVSGTDTEVTKIGAALAAGAITREGPDPTAEVVFVCVPASQVSKVATEILATAPGAVVTDVAGVKSRIAREVDDPRFVPGHPMAGSEREGIEGADAKLFEGRAWVLTPTLQTDPEAFARVHGVVSDLRARPIATTPERHDALVAVVSHVPHLVAAGLMDLAREEAEEAAELLPLAAGGFRDMTRIAAGSPEIWPDVCAQNSEAVSSVLDSLAERLAAVARIVRMGERQELLDLLRRARAARSSLPGLSTVAPDAVAELRIPIKDRPGALAEVTTLAAGLAVNIEDVEIVHLPEGGGGVLVMMVDARAQGRLVSALVDRGYETEVRGL